MPYTPVPNTGQSLGQTRDQIRNNIGALKSSIAINHVDLDLANTGKHTMVQIPSVRAASPGTAAGEVALYTRNVSGVPQLFIQKQSTAAAGADIQLTNALAPAVFTPTFSPGVTSSTSFVTFLPGNAFIASGNISGCGSSQQVTFPFTMSAVYSVQLTRNAFGAQPSNRSFHQLTALSANSFTFRNLDDGGSATSGFNVLWVLIGAL